METARTFKELIVWQKAHDLVLEVYKLTKKFPAIEHFGLTSQVRRAAVSVPANIVEGFRRFTSKDRLHFYHIADASLEETKYHLLLAKDLKYITVEEYLQVSVLFEGVGRLLTRWIQHQK